MKAPPVDVDAMMALARARDETAARALVEHLYPDVIAVIRRRLPRRTDAEDLAQEVFLRIFRSLPTFRGNAASLTAWARRIAFRVCLNAIRHERRRPELRWSDLPLEDQEILNTLAGAETSPHPDDAAASADLVAQFLAVLTPGDRWLVEMLEIEQRSPKEVAALTGWSQVNIRVRAFRARRKLRQAIERLVSSHE